MKNAYYHIQDIPNQIITTTTLRTRSKTVTKGQLLSKADWHAIDSPKKRTDEFVLFAFLLFTANKSNSSVRFLGESTARQSAFRFYLTFRGIQFEKFTMSLVTLTQVKIDYQTQSLFSIQTWWSVGHF